MLKVKQLFTDEKTEKILNDKAKWIYVKGLLKKCNLGLYEYTDTDPQKMEQLY